MLDSLASFGALTFGQNALWLLAPTLIGLLRPSHRLSDEDPVRTRKRFRALLEAIPDMVVVIDKKGTFLDCKPSEYLRPWVFPQDFLNKNVHDVLPPELARQTLSYVQQALRTKTTQVLGYELLADGKMRSYVARMVSADEDEVFVMIRDVTEGKRTEEALRLTVEGTSSPIGVNFSRSLTQHLAKAVHVRFAFVSQIADAEGKRVRLVSLWTGNGYGPHVEYDVAGTPCEHVVGKDLAYFPDVDERFPETPAWFKQAEIQSYLAIPLRDSTGGSLGHMGVMHDGPMYQVVRAESILKIFAALAAAEFERERAEEALRHSEEQVRQSQKMEAIGRLAGGVAHDFNNLLTAINGYTELVLSRLEPSDPLRRDIEEIRKAGQRAASLTRQLLAFGRRQVLQPKVLDLNDVVANVHKMLRRLIGEDIELVSFLEAGLGRVKADPGQMEQIIMNLAVNARDAMPQGGKLVIETKNVQFDEPLNRGQFYVPQGRYVMLAVSDNGVGMDKKLQTHIFEPFFTTKSKGKGTGLGLSTVYGIVKQSGGTIWVYSEPNQGSTFKVYLPRVDDAAPEADEWKMAAGNLPHGNETILLVEDQEGVRTLARRVLIKAGYTVLEAEDPKEALAICAREKRPIDMLLSDVIMPHMSGVELAERLRDTHPTLKVLFMSGYTDDAVVRHGVLEFGTDFLQKPFTSEALVRKVHAVLNPEQEEPPDAA